MHLALLWFWARFLLHEQTSLGCYSNIFNFALKSHEKWHFHFVCTLIFSFKVENSCRFLIRIFDLFKGFVTTTFLKVVQFTKILHEIKFRYLEVLNQFCNYAIYFGLLWISFWKLFELLFLVSCNAMEYQAAPSKILQPPVEDLGRILPQREYEHQMDWLI